MRYKNDMTPEQCRAARALLGWSQSDLAKRSKVSISAIRNFERGMTMPVVNNLDALKRAVEAGGVVLINDGKLGVAMEIRE